MVRRRSTVRFRNGAPGGLHVSVGTVFTFRSDILRSGWRGLARAVCCAGSCLSGLVRAGWSVLRVVVCVVAGVALMAGGVWGLGRCRGGGEASEALAAAFAGFRGQAGGGAARVVGLAGVPGGQDALVADDQH